MRKIQFRKEDHAERISGYFHQWCIRSYYESSNTYGICEDSQGQIHIVEPYNIIFMDITE